MQSDSAGQDYTTPEHPWISLETIQDVEAWMDLNNRELQELMDPKLAQYGAQGQGICLRLAHGGEIYLHTNSEGDVWLDLTAEAEWVAPVISATTQLAAPRGQIWILPQGALLQLILGLNSLIASSHLVLKHAYRTRKN
ncbi:hypothetical protein [Undibacterium parvum]|jgi:hypothetical protein|uniref:Uncharacterized protein n=1 Tax=Undibacterium parvum TaxID=401471 RepID=A0A3S9HIX3_9BURK|nr:hypothetical protein [Undibacterium parvum]AZP12052.1 hypothetical protein EJN92_08595 [Undibacterium parvum]